MKPNSDRYLKRFVDLAKDASKKSLFLFGPRQTGKTCLLKHLFPNSPFYNLLLSDVFLHLSQRPQSIREELEAMQKGPRLPIIIDEIQKLPLLLDEVHHLIEEKAYKFILTGSSPRKLRRGNANLLGGRAWTRHLYPLVFPEIPDFDLIRALNFGTIPSVYYSDEPEEDLLSYCGNYLQEEIQAEGAVRKIEGFSRFLQTAAFVNGELLNFESVANDAQVPARTVREYFSILEDTLVGELLEPYRGLKKRKAVGTAKFFLFDIGMVNTLIGRSNISPKTELFGKAFEHFIFCELRAYLDYTKDRRPLTFLRDQQGHEIDFLIGDDVAIEVKSTDRGNERHLKGFRYFQELESFSHRIVVTLDPKLRKVGNVEIMPYDRFLSQLWDKAFV